MSLWDTPEQQKGTGFFAQLEVKQETRVGKSGEYDGFNFCTTPLETQFQIKNQFYVPYDKGFNEVTKPSIVKLINDGIIAKFEDIEGDNFVIYQMSEYKSRAKNDINYWEKNNPDKIGTDPHGQYVIKKAHEILKIFPDMESWQKAYKDNAPTNDSITPSVVEPGKADEKTQILAVLPVIIESMKFDMTKLKDTLSHQQFSAYPIDSPEIKRIVIEVINKKANGDIAQQAILLAEINTHFEEPYLELSDLTDMIDEISF